MRGGLCRFPNSPPPPNAARPPNTCPVALITRELAIQSVAWLLLNVYVDARCDEGSHLSPVSRGRHSLTITAQGSVDFSLKHWKLAATVEGRAEGGGKRRWRGGFSEASIATSNKAGVNAPKLSGGKCPSQKWSASVLNSHIRLCGGRQVAVFWLFFFF